MSARDVADGFQEARDNVQNVTSFMSNAFNEGMDFILQPFVWPLLELLEYAMGDPDQLDQHATTWKTTAQAMRELAQAQRAELEGLTAQWKGTAADSYAARINQLIQGLETAADEMLRTADNLGDSAMDLRNIEEAIRDVIRELVEWLIITWLAAQALAAITAGASEAAALVASEGEAVLAASRITAFMYRLDRWLTMYKAWMDGLRSLGTVGKLAAWTLNKMYGPKHWIKEGIKALSGIDGAIVGQGVQGAGDVVMDAAADEYDDRRSGIDGDSGWRTTVSDYVDPVADRVP
ncbi:WXG100 family type VII secretion target [Actinoplanes teichomyceticus]|uniref:WXG100 family type VII secretion target n=1 Tax=Actinoplanes teichomyceticus TaxID=1867 RepID=A0A561WNQ0_ACTTI|nr:WXG100 family type VII secretion target [Actinoplanes teichomyceticus]TWG25487.1 WXG100 family type VII secretion target [Actinoplanes teichomyceticus]GIF10556.1 hypothetical protein Ate01nite_05880 [Actinoplanes teichomyceticus]